MRIFSFAIMLFLLAYGRVALADDYRDVVAACGSPTSTDISGHGDAWRKSVMFQPDPQTHFRVEFSGPTQSGPWVASTDIGAIIATCENADPQPAPVVSRASVVAPHTDDVTKVMRVCGAPAEAKTVNTPDGWSRILDYKTGNTHIDLNFGGPSRNGPWSYWGVTDFVTINQDDLARRVLAIKPCLKASGLITEPAVPAPASAPAEQPAAAGNATGGAAGFWGIILLLGIIVYILPTAVAQHRHCTAFNGILVVNLFLGWTFIGWVVALAWAASGATEIPAARAT